MAFSLPDLPYATDALMPYIDKRIMELHHGKHHAAYVAKLNAAVEGTPYADKSIEEILADLGSLPDNIAGAVRNNGGGHYNHTLFWQIMAPNAGGAPSGELAGAIDGAFGSFDKMKETFDTAGANRFGSGWAWLVITNEGRLEVTSTPNQDTPISEGHKVLLGNDVWEHAYYLQYENRRPEYLKAWWSCVNWNAVSERFAKLS